MIQTKNKLLLVSEVFLKQNLRLFIGVVLVCFSITYMYMLMGNMDYFFSLMSGKIFNDDTSASFVSFDMLSIFMVFNIGTWVGFIISLNRFVNKNEYIPFTLMPVKLWQKFVVFILYLVLSYIASLVMTFVMSILLKITFIYASCTIYGDLFTIFQNKSFWVSTSFLPLLIISAILYFGQIYKALVFIFSIILGFMLIKWTLMNLFSINIGLGINIIQIIIVLLLALDYILLKNKQNKLK